MSQVWQSIPQLFFAQADRWGSRPLVYGKPNMHWRPLTWRQVANRSLCIASGLITLGVDRGDRVAIWMKSCPEWMLCDLGSLSAGCVNVPIHETASDAELTYLLRDSESIGVFVDDEQQASRIQKLKALLPHLSWIVIVFPHRTRPPLSAVLNPEQQSLEAVKSSYLLRDFNVISDEDFQTYEGQSTLLIHHLEDLEKRDGKQQDVQERLAQIDRHDTLTLQYTSGTTGEPKGVILSHHNILSNCEAALEAVPVTPDDVLLSFLPLSHSFERLAGYYMPTLFGGATLYFSEGLGRLIRNLNEVSPTVMTGVPRIYEKIYARFRGARGTQGKIRKALSTAALTLNPSETNSSPSNLTSLINEGRKWINRQLFSEFRERLGGRLRFMVSGGAPLDEQVAQFFSAAGLLILEGYGLSETSPVLTVNRPHAYRFGSVGKPLNHVQIRLAPDGEILVKGPNVTQGYYEKKNETAKLFNPDGWLLTGDIGHFDQDGFLFITDRKKDIFKTASGKMVAPQYIERLFNSSPLIEQTYIIGDQRPFCVALIVPSLSEVNAWAQDRGYILPSTGRVDWGKDPELIRLFENEVEQLNKRLSRHETVKRFHLCPESFVIDELTTPSLKLKRGAALTAYSKEIASLYGDKTFISKLKS